MLKVEIQVELILLISLDNLAFSENHVFEADSSKKFRHFLSKDVHSFLKTETYNTNIIKLQKN